MSISKERPLIDAVEALYKNHSDLFTDAQRIAIAQDALDCIAQFFNVNAPLAALLALIIYDQLLDDITPLKQHMKRLGFTVRQAADTLDAVHQLRKQGWLHQSKRRGLQGKMCFELSKSALDAVLLNDATRLVTHNSESQHDALLGLHKQFQHFSGEDVLPDIILTYAQACAHMPFFKILLNDKNLKPCDQLVLLWMGAEYVNGNETPELTWISDTVFDSCRDELNRFKYNLRHAPYMRDQNYIRFASQDFPDVDRCMLGDALLDTIDAGHALKTKHRPALKQCQLIESDQLITQNLHYNAAFAAQIQELYTITAPENYTSITAQCKTMGLPQGLTILLSGPPGTGKTETVKQMARFHKRDVLQVNMSEFKSMWLGESEKNVTKIFREYKAYKGYSAHTPILFINEADALLSKRQAVESTVGQVMNTIQNILLQALEDFEGILIATTNQTQNFDTAFDRRFLYKLHFELPDINTRTSIIAQELPMLDIALQQHIATTYSLSGAQIHNIKRRIVMRQILSSAFTPEWNWLKPVIESECKLPHETEIGFRRAS
jgi:KaiC/GvpD/RAD55 family RecA-like ATPase